MNIEYAAGLIDGEGYIGIQEAGGSFQVRLKVAMTDKGRPALMALSSLFGGRVRPDKAQTERSRESHVWTVTGLAATEIIEQLRPHLIVKTAAADIALEFRDLHMSLEPHPRRGRLWTPAALERAAMLRSRIQEANRRGPDPKPPTLPSERPLAVYRHGWWWEPDEDLFGPVEFEGRLPTCGRMVAGHVYATPSWAERMESEAVALLPTPTTEPTTGNGHARSLGAVVQPD